MTDYKPVRPQQQIPVTHLKQLTLLIILHVGPTYQTPETSLSSPLPRRSNLPNARDLSVLHPYHFGLTHQTYTPPSSTPLLPQHCSPHPYSTTFPHTTVPFTSSRRSSQCYHFASRPYGLASSTLQQTELRELDYRHPPYSGLRHAAEKCLL